MGNLGNFGKPKRKNIVRYTQRHVCNVEKLSKGKKKKKKIVTMVALEQEGFEYSRRQRSKRTFFTRISNFWNEAFQKSLKTDSSHVGDVTVVIS